MEKKNAKQTLTNVNDNKKKKYVANLMRNHIRYPGLSALNA